ncbi:MAG: phosphatidylglycerol lysyltransferase domain-containing protein [Desulfobacterales bacterium]|nr:phosphatidylglycerol lysyltransferase domain-containing protein [Desulfobacterales bacterium]
MTQLHHQCGLTPLTPKDHPHLRPFFEGQSFPLCGYSLTALIIWKTNLYYPVYAIGRRDLFIARLYPEAPPKSYFTLPVPGGREWPPEKLKELCCSHKLTKVAFVDEAYMAKWGEKNVRRFFSIREQTDYEDYVYRKEDLAELKGNRYSKKRNLINQFRKSHVELGRVSVEAVGPGNVEACRQFLNRWWNLRDEKAQNDEEAQGEKIACSHALDLVGIFPDLRGIALRVDGEVAAFGMATDLTHEMADFNFQKADPTIKGLYQFFDRQCARMLFDGVSLINKECDMDDPGLRKAKRSYHPAYRFKSFELTLKEKDAAMQR